MEPRIMTIVVNSPEEDPIIISSGIPGSVTHRENELNFLRETLKFFEQKVESLNKADANFGTNSQC